jgi:uncharacterized peroxidase-related enzyme
MPHIDVGNPLPGIRGLMVYRPETAKPLRELAEVLLVADSTLSRGERELIATHVSHRNGCVFCCTSHAAAARVQLPDGERVVAATLADPATAPVSPKLAALLRIAGKVQTGGRSVTDDDVARAKALGATDREIHDTVLIAAAFCMYNRYVDGLATWHPPVDSPLYDEGGRRVALEGYVNRSDLPPIDAPSFVGAATEPRK